MRKGYALGIIILFLLISSMNVAKPVSADQAVGNTWTELAPMNLARSNFGAAELDGKISAIGGSDEVATGGNENMPARNYTGGVVSTNEVYDPAANNWTLEAPMPTPRQGFAIATYKDKIYCIGGSTQAGGTVGVNQAYDPATNTWQTEASMPYAETNLQANVVDDKIYCVGGFYASGIGSRANQVYDPANNTWSENAPIPTSTFEYASATCNGKIYVINGVDWYSMYGLDLNQIYNPQNNTWNLGAKPPHPLVNSDGIVDIDGIYAGAATTGVMAPERIYAIGSYTQIYNPMTNSWSLGEGISPSRDGFAVVNVNDQLYIMGGVIDTGDLNGELATETEFNLTQLYTPVGYSTLRPEISILSPTNRVYNESSVPIVFTVDRAVSWEGYSLDGKANVTLSRNETTNGTPNGLHTIVLFANDTSGNMGASQPFYFTVAAPERKPYSSLMEVAVSVTVVVMVVVAAVLLFYFRNRNRLNKLHLQLPPKVS